MNDIPETVTISDGRHLKAEYFTGSDYAVCLIGTDGIERIICYLSTQELAIIEARRIAAGLEADIRWFA